MNEVTYEYIWDEIINSKIKQLYDAFSCCVDTKYHPQNHRELKWEIYDKYFMEKERLKELYYCGTDQESLIDIHKIAACFTKVLLEENIFHISLKQDIRDEIFLINSELAYSVGIGLIKMNLIFFYMELGKLEIVDRLQSSKDLQVPPTNPGHDEYNLGRKKTLALNSVYENEFDILTYSDMLFWIEYYNRQMLEQTVVPCPFKIESRMCDVLE